MDLETRQKLCRLIAGIVVADDDLDDREDAFVTKMLAQFGIPDEDRATIFPIVDAKEAAEQIREFDANTQQDAIALLVEAACADGKVVDEERAYLRAVGATVGLSHDDVEAKLNAKLAENSSLN